MSADTVEKAETYQNLVGTVETYRFLVEKSKQIERLNRVTVI